MKFGTSGLRGLVADLQGHASALYATAFAEHLLRNGLVRSGDRIFIGEDFRPSSADIASTCIGALQRSGLNPVSCGALPTPALALYAMSQNCASLMITGSHIPADRNGIKFYRPDGEIDKDDERAISAIAAEIESRLIDLTPGIAPSEASGAIALFRARTGNILPANALSGLRIGIYQHSSVARDLLAETIEAYGAEIVILGRSDAFIPLDTEAVAPETIHLLKGWAASHRLDAIVSTDGDGDRPLVSDERGEPLRGDILGLLVAQYLAADSVVTPVTSNSGIQKSGRYSVTRTRVGSPYVIAGMNQALASGKTNVIGFEANGGVLTGSDFHLGDRSLIALPTRDSFLPVLVSLFHRAKDGSPFSSVVSALDLPFSTADRIENFPVESSASLMAHLTSSAESRSEWLRPIGEVGSTDLTDGLRVTLKDGGILHFRPSGNAPEMRCYVEASDEQAAKRLLEQGIAALKGWAGAV
ncbi:phosphomannomutase [Rhizobium helianthi]|uniref:Phosphomannomutase n=1 Tax=Rhizobium helianthi TaxID=1132695 RepID=A0ABW4M0Y8_9HYPH